MTGAADTSSECPANEQELEAQLGQLEARIEALTAEHQVAYDALARLRENRFRHLSDEELLADEQARHALAREADRHAWASDRLRQLAPFAGLNVKVQGADSREGCRAWAEHWLLGRPDLHISVLESTLSEHGAYWIEYAPGEVPEAVLRRIRFGHVGELYEGTLEMVLAYIAEHHWLSASPRGSRDERRGGLTCDT